MAIISVRIFIRSIVVREKKKKSTWQYLRKNVHVHTERSSNCSRKAEQSSSSQLFPRLSIPPLFFSMSLVDFESIRTFSKLKPDLYCTGQLLSWTQDPGKPAFLTNDRLLSNIEARETKTSVFFQTYMLVYVWNIYHWPRETQRKTCL